MRTRRGAASLGATRLRSARKRRKTVPLGAGRLRSMRSRRRAASLEAARSRLTRTRRGAAGLSSTRTRRKAAPLVQSTAPMRTRPRWATRKTSQRRGLPTPLTCLASALRSTGRSTASRLTHARLQSRQRLLQAWRKLRRQLWRRALRPRRRTHAPLPTGPATLRRRPS